MKLNNRLFYGILNTLAILSIWIISNHWFDIPFLFEELLVYATYASILILPLGGVYLLVSKNGMKRILGIFYVVIGAHLIYQILIALI
jgi:hypothetical protein